MKPDFPIIKKSVQKKNNIKCTLKSLRMYLKVTQNKLNILYTMNLNKSTNNKRKLDNEEFSWSDDEIQLLLEVTLYYESTCELGGISWESKRRKYENICEQQVECFPPREDLYQNRDKLNKDRAGAKVKSIRAN